MAICGNQNPITKPLDRTPVITPARLPRPIRQTYHCSVLHIRAPLQPACAFAFSPIPPMLSSVPHILYLSHLSSCPCTFYRRHPLLLRFSLVLQVSSFHSKGSSIRDPFKFLGPVCVYQPSLPMYRLVVVPSTVPSTSSDSRPAINTGHHLLLDLPYLSDR